MQPTAHTSYILTRNSCIYTETGGDTRFRFDGNSDWSYPIAPRIWIICEMLNLEPACNSRFVFNHSVILKVLVDPESFVLMKPILKFVTLSMVSEAAIHPIRVMNIFRFYQMKS